MMDVPVTEIISACMMLGMMVTMNQRLDAETLKIVAEEFDHTRRVCWSRSRRIN